MKRNFILIIFSVFLFLILPLSVFSKQSASKYGINEKTKECSKFFMGDECVACALPNGWEIIKEFQCPVGYKEVHKNSVCTPQKNSFCCTIQHSGKSGDCDDVVVNDSEKKCAFIEDARKCEKLPKNWKQAEEIDSWGKVCPSLSYKWEEKLVECDLEKSIENNINSQENNKNQNSKTILSNIFFLLIVIFLVVFGVFVIKRK